MRINTAPLERKDGGASEPTMTEIKDLVEGQGRAFNEFKTTNDQRLKELEKKGAADPLLDEKLKKIDQFLDGGEAFNQQLVKSAHAKQAEKDMAELKDLVNGLELKLKRPGTGGSEDQQRAERKNKVNAWLRASIAAQMVGINALSAEQQKSMEDVRTEMKALGVTDDTTGGYLAPVEQDNTILKTVTEISPVRSMVRVRPTGGKSVMQPKRTGQFAARRVGELQQRTETAGETWGMVEIDAPEMYALVDISLQNLEDSAYDLEAEINEEASDQFAVKEGAEFVSGTGIGQMEGILVNAGVPEIKSGNAATVSADGVLGLYYGVKTAYTANGLYILNRRTIGSVRKLKDQQNNYLWAPIAVGAPATINGALYREVPDMPDEGAGTYPVAFGDFRRAYTMADRIFMQMLKDPYTQAAAGCIRFLFRRRVGGRVVLAEALNKLKCST